MINPPALPSFLAELATIEALDEAGFDVPAQVQGDDPWTARRAPSFADLLLGDLEQAGVAAPGAPTDDAFGPVVPRLNPGMTLVTDLGGRPLGTVHTTAPGGGLPDENGRDTWVERWAMMTAEGRHGLDGSFLLDASTGVTALSWEAVVRFHGGGGDRHSRQLVRQGFLPAPSVAAKVGNSSWAPGGHATFDVEVLEADGSVTPAGAMHRVREPGSAQVTEIWVLRDTYAPPSATTTVRVVRRERDAATAGAFLVEQSVAERVGTPVRRWRTAVVRTAWTGMPVQAV